MLLVEQRGDDDVKAYGFSLSGGAGNQQVGHLAEVEHVDFVGDGPADGDGQVVCRLQEFAGGEDALYRDDAGMLVGDFDSDGSLAGNRRDDADSESREAEGDVVFQVPDFGDAHPGCGSYLVKRYGRAYCGFYAADLDAETVESGDNAVFVFDLLFRIYAGLLVAVVFQQVECRKLVELQSQAGVVSLHGLGRGCRIDIVFFAFFYVECNVVGLLRIAGCGGLGGNVCFFRLFRHVGSHPGGGGEAVGLVVNGEFYGLLFFRVRGGRLFLPADSAHSGKLFFYARLPQRILRTSLRGASSGFFSQPFSVASVYTGMEGKYVPLAKTIESCNAILDGKCDDIPESEFYFIGDLSDIKGYAQ